MRALSLLLLLFVLIGYGTLGAQPITITGHLFGHDGRQLVRANAYLFRPRSMTPVASARAEADGTFRLAADAPGFFTATFTGANHREHSIVLVIDRARTVRLDVRLGRGPRILQFDSAGHEVPTIIGDASADSSAGALAGARSGAARELPDSLAVVVYHDPEVGRLAEVIACIREQEPTWERARDSVRRVGGSAERFAYDWAPELRRLERAIAAEHDSLSARFGVTGVPTPILVDAEGRILAREGLLGRALERTPARYLGPPDATGPAIKRTDR